MRDSNGSWKTEETGSMWESVIHLFQGQPMPAWGHAAIKSIVTLLPSTRSRPAPCGHAPTKFTIKGMLPLIKKRWTNCFSWEIFRFTRKSQLAFQLKHEPEDRERCTDAMPTHGVGLDADLIVWPPKEQDEACMNWFLPSTPCTLDKLCFGIFCCWRSVCMAMLLSWSTIFKVDDFFSPPKLGAGVLRFGFEGLWQIQVQCLKLTVELAWICISDWSTISGFRFWLSFYLKLRWRPDLTLQKNE